MIKSSFFEFSVATSALFTAQANIQVNSHNLANMNTKGYSRQYAVTKANKPMAGNGVGMYGTGSSVNSIKRYRDEYLDTKYWNKSSMLGNYSSKAAQLKTLELTFNELSGTGANSAFNDLFDQLQELSMDPGNLTIRNNVTYTADSLTKLIKSLGAEINKQQTDIDAELVTMVDIINSIGKQIGTLNEQIKFYEASGDNANDLRDQRTVLVDELSKYVNVSVSENLRTNQFGLEELEFRVQLNGQDFVKAGNVSLLETVARGSGVKKNPNDAEGLHDIVFAATGIEFAMYSDSLKGELKGLIDMRDGNNDKDSVYAATGGRNKWDEKFEDTTSYKGIPHYQDKLNQLIRVFAQGFDQGKDYNGNPLNGVTGHQYGYNLNGKQGTIFFTYTDSTGKAVTTSDTTSITYANMTYENFVINPDLLADPRLFAASISEGADESKNDLVLGLITIWGNSDLFAEGKLEDYIAGMTSELSISAKQANKFDSMYTDTTVMVDNQRLSVSSVDENEEMSLLLMYQQMYQAAAKLVNVIDEVYDTCINKLGTGF